MQPKSAGSSRNQAVCDDVGIISGALDIRTGPPSEVQIPTTSKVRGLNHRTAVVVKEQNWRGRRDHKHPILIRPLVPKGEKAHFIPYFDVSWPFDWGRIANGEKVIHDLSPVPATPISGSQSKSSNTGVLENGGTICATVAALLGQRSEIIERFLTPTGLPVRARRVADNVILLESLTWRNAFAAGASYPLDPFDERESAFEVAVREDDAGGSVAVRPAARDKSLAPIIDSLLLSGRSTMTGIVRELRRKASAACQGKDLKANVRARLYWLKRRGYRLEKTDQGQLRLSQPAAASQ